MHTGLAALAATAVLSLSAVAASAQSSTYEGAVGETRSMLGSAAEDLAAIEAPSKEEVAAMRAVAKADALLAKALLRPSTLGFVKSARKADRLLAPGVQVSEGIDVARWILFMGMREALYVEVMIFREQAGYLPESDEVDDFLLAIEALQQVLGDLGEVDAEDRFAAMEAVASDLAKFRKRHMRFVLAAAGKPGLSAVVDGTPFVADQVSGWLTVDGETGRPLVLQVYGQVRDPRPASTHGITLSMQGFDMGQPIWPGAYSLSENGVANFEKSAGRSLERLIIGNQGTITLLAIDAVKGQAWGTFSFTGPESGPEAVQEVGEVISGGFHIRNLEILENVP